METRLWYASLIERLRQSAIAKRLTVYGVSASASQFMMMLYTLLIARFLGPESFGLYAGNYALATITIFLVNWGMDTWMLREGVIQESPKALCRVVSQTKFMMGVIWICLLVGIAPLVRPGLYPRALLLICALDLLCDALVNTFVSGLNIDHQTSRASKLLLITRGGRLFSAVILILVGTHEPIYFAFARGLSTFIGVILGLVQTNPGKGYKRNFFSLKILRLSTAYGVTDLLALIYASADVNLLTFLKDKVAVGEYSPALSLINALMIVPMSFFNILVPSLSETYHLRLERFKRAVKQMAATYVGIGLLLSVSCALIISPLLSFLLGAKYSSTGLLILILSPILFFKGVSYGSANYLVAVGWQSKRIWSQALSAVLNIGLNLIFIPQYGPKGAAVVYVFSEFVLAVGYLITSFYHYQRKNL